MMNVVHASNASTTQVFNFQGSEVRTVTINENPWFLAKDVCKILEIQNVSQALENLDSDEKGISNTYTLRGNQEMMIISESGLYSLILRSRKQEAKAFKKWVTSEVLPSIRKHGAYATPATIDSILANPDFGIKLLQDLKKEREENLAKSALLEQKEAKLIEQAPKVEYCDRVLNTTSEITTTTIAKELNTSAVNLNKFLAKKDVVFNIGGVWHLKAKYIGKGYTAYRTYIKLVNGIETTYHTLVWTEKGRNFIHSLYNIEFGTKNLF